MTEKAYLVGKEHIQKQKSLQMIFPLRQVGYVSFMEVFF